MRFTLFDENIFFNNCKRVLKKDGFIILFGRGVSFYRMNIILDSLDFIFKEEIIWDKTQNSSPVMKISRVHETCSIFSKGKTSYLQSVIFSFKNFSAKYPLENECDSG